MSTQAGVFTYDRYTYNSTTSACEFSSTFTYAPTYSDISYQINNQLDTHQHAGTTGDPCVIPISPS